MASQKLAPIFVMSFNRPEYLDRVLASLRGQTGGQLEGRDIFLFQDGAVNRFSGERRARDKDIAASIAVFTRHFPAGKVMASPDNIGVALNFERAEVFGFEDLKAEKIIFLEDDMELTPHYLTVLEALAARYEQEPRVGYVAAYGDHKIGSLEVQEQRQNELILLYHNWAFMLFRRHWLRMRPHVRKYLDLVKDVDYQQRDAAKIHHLFSVWGFGIRATSQDVAKTLACCLEETVKLNTLTCNARYIGEHGLHMRPESYVSMGFDGTVLFPRPVTDWAALDDAAYDRLLDEQFRWAEAPRQPVTVADVDFVHAVYQGILGRAPDPGGLQSNVSRLRHGTPPAKIIRSILESRESIRTNGPFFNTQTDAPE